MSEVATAPAAPAPAPSAPAPAPAAPAPAPASVLGSGAANAPAPSSSAAPAPSAPAPAPADPLAWAPEKYRVMGSDGKSLDVEGTARKIAEAHGHLERRLGSGDAPPASVDGYKLNVPETLAGKVNTEDLAKAPDFIEFQKNMHGLGLSQKQLDGVTAVLLERGIKMREAMPILDAAEATSKLRGMDGWKSDEEYQRQVGRAYAAGKHYAGNDFDGVLKDYGNDPRIVAMLARVGAEARAHGSRCAPVKLRPSTRWTPCKANTKRSTSGASHELPDPREHGAAVREQLPRAVPAEAGPPAPVVPDRSRHRRPVQVHRAHGQGRGLRHHLAPRGHQVRRSAALAVAGSTCRTRAGPS
jgi:hypothetical protein